jgi:osmotically inducible protein OsmC
MLTPHRATTPSKELPMPQTSTSRAHWTGPLGEGSGVVSTTSSAISNQELTWKARTGGSAGTTPEELLAAGLAGCYSMALAGALGGAGHAPDTIDTEVEMTFGPTDDGGFAISGAIIRVTASVPGIDASDFGEAAEGAKVGCPVSKAFAGNIPVTLEASLA